MLNYLCSNVNEHFNDRKAYYLSLQKVTKTIKISGKHYDSNLKGYI